MRFINIHEEYIDIYLSLIKHLYLGWSFVGEQDIHRTQSITDHFFKLLVEKVIFKNFNACIINNTFINLILINAIYIKQTPP